MFLETFRGTKVKNVALISEAQGLDLAIEVVFSKIVDDYRGIKGERLEPCA